MCSPSVPKTTTSVDELNNDENVSARWRILLTEAEYAAVEGHIRALQQESIILARGPVELQRLSRRGVASFMGYGSAFVWLPPTAFINSTRNMNARYAVDPARYAGLRGGIARRKTDHVTALRAFPIRGSCLKASRRRCAKGGGAEHDRRDHLGCGYRGVVRHPVSVRAQGETGTGGAATRRTPVENAGLAAAIIGMAVIPAITIASGWPQAAFL